MAKYKTVVHSINANQTDAPTAKLPAGTWYLNISFKPSDKYVNDFAEWQPVEDPDLRLWKRYYMSHDIEYAMKDGSKKSLYQITVENLKKDFDFEGNDSEIQGIVGLEREIVTEINDRNYEEIKWINGPHQRKPLVDENKKEDFASFFNR